MQEKQIDEQIELKDKLCFKKVKTYLVQREMLKVNLSGNILVAANRNGCQVYEMITGKIIASLQGIGVIGFVVLDNGFGDRVAISLGKTVRLFNISSRKQSTLIGHSAKVQSILFDKNSQFIATGSSDSTARLWDVQTGKQIQIYQGHNKTILSLHFNSGGDKLITSSSDCTARIWDVRSGNSIHILDEHKHQVCCSKFNYTGDYCATGSMDCTCKIWDVKTGKCVKTLAGHVEGITNLNFNINGTRLITTSEDFTSRVYNVNTGECISQLHNCYFGFDLYLQSKNYGSLEESGDFNPKIYSEKGKHLQSLMSYHVKNCCYSIHFGGVIGAFSNECNDVKLIIWKQMKK